MRKVLAFDLGGTKFAFGVVNQDGTVLGSGRVETFAEKGPQQACERVAPARVEQILLATGLVKEALVLGMVDVRWGEVVTACVIGPASAESTLRQACEALESAARPRRYVFVPSMPTNASGKPDREAIAKLTA